MIAIRNILFLILTNLSPFLGTSQVNSIIDNFNLTVSNQTVFVSWTISSGRTCNGINLWRSADSITFEKIHEIAGICGSSSEPIPYNYTDDKPVFNKKMFYKLELGGYGFSEAKSIEIINVLGDKYQIRPHPIVNNSKVYFNKSKNAEYSLFIYNFFGSKIEELKTRQQYFIINAEDYPEGLYVFIITEDFTTVISTGKFLVDKRKK